MSTNEASLLILSGVQGSPRRYRTFHLYEQARLAGISCQLSHITDPSLRKKAEKANVVILHRALYDAQVAWLEKSIHRRGGILIQDLDDLVFDPEAVKYIHHTEFMDPVRLSLYQEDIRLHRQTLDMCDAVLTSGEFLTDRVRQLGKPAKVHRNAFSLEMLSLAEQSDLSRKIDRKKIVIGYASGTPTHDQDFALVKPVLKVLLSRYTNLELWIVGPLDPGRDWNNLARQIRRIGLVPWRKLPDIQAQFDINLAPLEIDNPFGQSKSEIKYVEAALLRIPTVASPSQAFKYAIQPGDNGFLAGDPQEWEQILEELINQAELRTHAGEKAYQDVKLRYHPALRARELVETFKSILGEKYSLPIQGTSTPAIQDNLLQSYWSSAELEKTPTLLQRGFYTLKYRSLRTLLRQIWIYIRRTVSPIFPYRNPV